MSEPNDDFLPPTSKGFFYVATPYRGYLAGGPLSDEERWQLAYEAAARFTARLINHGVEVFSPIVHSHYVARFVTVANPDSDFWLRVQEPFMTAARGIIIGKIPGWDVSSGIKHERAFFKARGKPIYCIDELFTSLPGSLR